MGDIYKTPGQLIRGLLETRGWTHRVLALVLGMEETAVGRILADKRSVDANLAVSLEEVFGVSAEKFLGLQKSYDLAMARLVATPDPKRAMRAHLFGDIPIAAMIKRGWLEATSLRDPQLEGALIKFFGVNRVEDIETLPHAAKKTQTNVPPTAPQLAWLYRVRHIATEMIVGRYSPQAVRKAIGNLKSLLAAPEEVRNVPRILAECGIRFAIVESLPSAKIDGVCFWLDENSPVIGMTIRYDRIDNFWFVLRHELEHVLCRHGLTSAMLDTEMEGKNAGTGSDIQEEERIANEAASDFCVPNKMMDAFIARKAPLFYERDIIGFSRTINVHPGLIAGQIRHRTGKYDRFGNHLVKIRSLIAPSALVDGWGDVVPVEI